MKITLNKESRTTLIIGAGASTDFSRATKKDDDEKEENKINLPTGEELVRKMINFGNEIPKYFLYEYLRNCLESLLRCGHRLHEFTNLNWNL
jgi:hypothetical protein